jgi:hypothetical protein
MEEHRFTERAACNASLIAWSSEEFGTSPFFIYELALDVLLAVILVAFLNYQFEASFRMSFFGDVQARRDTAKMRVVRDQVRVLKIKMLPCFLGRLAPYEYHSSTRSRLLENEHQIQ